MNNQGTYLRALFAVMLAALVFALLFGRPGPSAQHSWTPTTYNAGPSGLRALYETLRDAHWNVGRWQDNYLDLPAEKGVAMVITRSPYGRKAVFSQGEIDRLWSWMEGGRTLVLLGNFEEWDDTRPFLAKLGLPATGPSSQNVFERSAAMLSARRTMVLEPAGSATAPSSSSPRIVENTGLPMGLLAETKPVASILWQSKGIPQVASFPVGSGTLVLGASPSLFDNEMLRNPSNMALVTQLLAPRGQAPAKVWFEEAHHGFRSSYAATDLLSNPGLRLAGVQIGVLVLLFLGSQMVRFGQIVPLERSRQRATMEFVNSMAMLYQRANLRDAVVTSLYQETHKRVLRKLNLPEGTSHEIIARQLAEGFPTLPKWKKLAARFDRKDGDFVQGLAPTGWLKTAQELIAIKNAMV